MIRATVLAVMLAGCVPMGPTDVVDTDVAPPGTFRLPLDEDRFGARLGTKVAEFAQDLAHQYGRFGSPEGVVMSPDERVVVIAVRDHPSTCLCDRDRGVRDAGTMVAVVERSSEREPKVTRLFDHGSGVDTTVAVSREHVAVAEYQRVRIWPRDDLATFVEHRLEISAKRLFWTDDGESLVAVNDTEVEVVDAGTGARRARWKVPGYIRGAALQDSDVLVLHVMPIVTDGEWWIPYRLDGRVARSL